MLAKAPPSGRGVASCELALLEARSEKLCPHDSLFGLSVPLVDVCLLSPQIFGGRITNVNLTAITYPVPNKSLTGLLLKAPKGT